MLISFKFFFNLTHSCFQAMIADSGGPMFRSFVEPTLSTVLKLLLSLQATSLEVKNHLLQLAKFLYLTFSSRWILWSDLLFTSSNMLSSQGLRQMWYMVWFKLCNAKLCPFYSLDLKIIVPQEWCLDYIHLKSLLKTYNMKSYANLQILQS